MITVGIDLAQKTSHKAAVRLDDGTVTGVRTVGWDARDLQEFTTWVESYRSDMTEPIRVMMEPTGTAWITLGQFFARQGWQAYLVKSQVVHDLRKFYQHHVKNDRLDAWTLAQIPVIHPKAPMALCFDQPKIQSLVRWVKRQHQRSREVSRVKLALQARAEGMIPGITALFPNLDAAAARWVFQNALNPFYVQQKGRRWLGRGLHKAGGTWAKRSIGEVGTAMWELVGKACALYGTQDGMDWGEMVLEIEADWELLELLQQQHRTAAKRARQLYQELYPDSALETIPGVGKLGAPIFAAALASHDFPSASAFRGYTGMIPTVKQSGLNSFRGQHLTRAGPRWLKNQLYLAAETARRFDPQLAAVYYRERVEKGHVHRQAVVAVATHLANRIWKVFTTQQPYELRDPAGNPLAPQDAREYIAKNLAIPKALKSRKSKGAGHVGAGRPIKGPQLEATAPSTTVPHVADN